MPQGINNEEFEGTLLNDHPKDEFGDRWTPDCHSAFDSIIVKLTSAPILGFGNTKLPYVLHLFRRKLHRADFLDTSILFLIFVDLFLVRVFLLFLFFFLLPFLYLVVPVLLHLFEIE